MKIAFVLGVLQGKNSGMLWCSTSSKSAGYKRQLRPTEIVACCSGEDDFVFLIWVIKLSHQSAVFFLFILLFFLIYKPYKHFKDKISELTKNLNEMGFLQLGPCTSHSIACHVKPRSPVSRLHAAVSAYSDLPSLSRSVAQDISNSRVV